MSLTSVTTEQDAAASDIEQYKQHLEGDAGKTLAWLFRVAANSDLIIVMSDNAGAQKVSFKDSADAEVASIDSDGNLTLSGTFSPATWTIPTASAPSQTTEGQAVWDTDDDELTIGDGSGRIRIKALTENIVKTSDESLTSDDTLQNDDDLLLAIGANETWTFKFVLFITTGASGDFKFAVTFPTSPTAVIYGPLASLNLTPSLEWTQTGGTAIGMTGSVTTETIVISGSIANGSNAGTIQLQWAQNTSNGTATVVETGSYAEFHLVE